MATNGISSNASMQRITGLATGLDTDTLIKNLMQSEKVPLNKLIQKRQLAEWKRDGYRDITNLLRGIKDSYLNIVKPGSNMLSQSIYKKFTGTSSDSNILTVSGNADASEGTHTVSVYSLATADKAVSNGGIAYPAGGVTDPLAGTAVSNYSLSGKKISITLDGITREIVLDDYSYTPGSPGSSDIVSKASTGLQALVNSAFGSGKITVDYDGATGAIDFASLGGAGRITLSSGSSNDALSSIGFVSGATNRLNTAYTLQNLSGKFTNDLTFDTDGKLKFTINSKEFVFDRSITLSSMMNTINADATAKVNIQYDELTDKFTMTAKQLGAGNNITIDAATQTGNFFGASGASGINTGNAETTSGVDAVVKIDGQIVTRGSNTITLNGVGYTLKKAHATPDTQSETVSLSQDVDAVYNSIKSYIDKYNEAIDKINGKLSEKYDKDYQPLTDDQKADMKTEDITKWEDKAKVGLLRNDSILQNMVYNMRRALSDSIQGVSTKISDIGITTGSYEDKGRLTIDETKLKDAIRNDPESVMSLFSKQSSVTAIIDSNSTDKAARYNEEGLVYRLSDIIDNNIRTIRDKNGHKGVLLEKAGIQGDITEFTSIMYKEIYGYDTSIKDLNVKLTDKETKYYSKFAKLEQAISRMNSQSSWLSSQFGQNSQ